MSISGKHIWVCPLNWGLGHASRCIPLIQALTDEGAQVYLASDGEAAALLTKEFPQLPCFELPSYHIRYGQRSAIAGLFWRLPGIFQAIKKEQRAFTRLLEQHPCDLVISDNRYGIFAKNKPSTIITHQLNLPVAAAVKPFSQSILKHWLSSFDELWIPDWDGMNSLAGKLSNANFKLPIRHLGILSRLQPQSVSAEFDLLAVLSGPEPQRSVLEKSLLDKMKDWPGCCCLVRGTPHPSDSIQRHRNIEIIDLADTKSLQELIPKARLLICRTGYSSLMDLVQMQKAALLIPTPGQPEQEYLGAYHAEKNWCLVQRQSEINLKEAWNAMKKFGAPVSKAMDLAGWLSASDHLLNRKAPIS